MWRIVLFYTFVYFFIIELNRRQPGSHESAAMVWQAQEEPADKNAVQVLRTDWLNVKMHAYLDLTPIHYLRKFWKTQDSRSAHSISVLIKY